MAKEKAILINMRIPKSILTEFDNIVDNDVLVPTRTALIITLMHAEIMKRRRKGKQ